MADHNAQRTGYLAPAPWLRRLTVPLVIVVVIALLVIWGHAVGSASARLSAQTAAVVQLRGEATARRSGSNTWSTVKSGDLFRPGDALRVNHGGDALLRYPDGSRVTVREDSELALRGPADGKELELRRGMVRIAAVYQPPRSPMKVFTPRALASVAGTQFWLSDDGHRSRLVLEEGTIYFGLQDQLEIFEVKGGQFADVATDIPVTAHPFQDLEFVDTDVIFEDDFESGLGKWEAATRDKDMVRPPRIDAALLMSRASTSTSNRSTVLVLDAMTTSNQWTEVHPKIPLSEQTVALEYDWLMETNTESFDLRLVAIDFTPAESDSIQLDRPQDLRPYFSPLQWNHSRTEMVMFRDPNGENAILMTCYVNGQRVARSIDFGRIEHLSFPMGINLRMWVDNVVVKGLEPKR